MSISSSARALLEPGQRSKVRVALVGASRVDYKFGNIILKDLLKKGFVVDPVNPNCSEVEGLPTRPDLASLQSPPHIVNFVVPARTGREVLEAMEQPLDAIAWFQPGSFDADLVDRAKQRFREVIAGPCIMVEAP